MSANIENHQFNRPKIAVTSVAFGKSVILREELKQAFPNSYVNELGRKLSESELTDFLKDADAAIVALEPITEQILDQTSRLKMISKFGVGLDNINQELLNKKNIALGWTGGTNKRSLAELALCFMLGICRNIFTAGFKLKQSVWDKDGGHQLTGKTVGIVGCGHTGSEVIRLLAPFKCTVLVRDILDKSEFCRQHSATEASLEEIITQADLISFHVPLTSLTNKIVDADFLSKMKPTAFLINTCRGGIVDQDALKKALQQGHIAGAALDVFAEEPPQDQEFLSLPNLMVTPHIGGNAEEAVEAMGRAAIQHLISFFENSSGNPK